MKDLSAVEQLIAERAGVTEFQPGKGVLSVDDAAAVIQSCATPDESCIAQILRAANAWKVNSILLDLVLDGEIVLVWDTKTRDVALMPRRKNGDSGSAA